MLPTLDHLHGSFLWRLEALLDHAVTGPSSPSTFAALPIATCTELCLRVTFCLRETLKTSQKPSLLKGQRHKQIYSQKQACWRDVHISNGVQRKRFSQFWMFVILLTYLISLRFEVSYSSVIFTLWILNLRSVCSQSSSPLSLRPTSASPLQPALNK